MSFHGRGTNFYTQKSEAAWSRAMVESVTALFRRGRPSVRFSIASIFALLLSISTAPPSLALTVAAPLSSTKITSRFGYRIHPVTNKYSFHNGVDFKAKLNQDVKAVMPGVVVKAGWRGNLGKAVEIYHPDKKLRTIYGSEKGRAFASWYHSWWRRNDGAINRSPLALDRKARKRKLY
jgi:murein DD-endopeptidase MepM/ murein hydrolase activator NlpD